uniref:Uncharacterized protein n=1 Tax=Caenorhabditis japonica TaxID=281687 RepID=A0A8R1IS90_CAEJA
IVDREGRSAVKLGSKADAPKRKMMSTKNDARRAVVGTESSVAEHATGCKSDGHDALFTAKLCNLDAHVAQHADGCFSWVFFFWILLFNIENF